MSIKSVQNYSVQNNGLRRIPTVTSYPVFSSSPWKRNPAWLPMTGFNYSIDSTFNTNAGTGFNGTVMQDAPKLQSDGKILVGGFFTLFNGSTQKYIIRLNTNGTKDTGFTIGTGFNDSVESIVLQSDDKILVGGSFTTYDGTTRNRIIRLNSNGSIDSSFSIGTGFDNSVKVIRVQTDGKILVGGDFTSYNGTTYNRIIRLNSDGSIDSSFSIGTGFPLFSSPYTIAIQSDGKILVGGDFTSYNGSTSKFIIRLNVNGTVDSSFSVANTEPFKSSGGGGVRTYKILIDSYNKIFVGGYYGASVTNLLRLNSDGSADESFIKGTFNAVVLNMEFQQDKILVVGEFTTYNNVSTGGTGLARINYNGQRDTTLGLGTGFGNYTRAVLVQTDNKILVFGETSIYQGSTISSRIARLNVTEEKISILKAVYPQSDFAAFYCGGNYTVDWGDGNVINYTANTVASHQYFSTEANLTNTNGNVTFLDSGDYVFRSNHGYANTDIISFANITTTTGITVDTPYYVINANVDYFKLSNTSGGSAVTMTTDGSGAILPYKQVVINITPQASANLVRAQIHYKNTTINTKYESGFLDIAASIPQVIDQNIGFGIGTPYMGNYTPEITLHMCESVTIFNSGNLTSLSWLCNELRNLRSISTSDTSKITDMSYMFRNCNVFETAPTMNTANVTNMSGMFNFCYSLNSIPLYNTANVTNMTSMFGYCYNITSVPQFNTSKVTGSGMNSMFDRCFNLQEVPLFDTSLLTSMNYTFQLCVSLRSVPLFNTANCTQLVNTFADCQSVTEYPLFNTTKVTSIGAMFYNNYSLIKLPLFDFRNVTSAPQSFQNCFNLTELPNWDLSKNINWNSMFANCRRLQSIPNFNTLNATNMNYTFSSCRNLKSVPLFNTANVTTMMGMLSSCINLRSVPLFNTAKVQYMDSMFNECYNLESVPLFNTANVLSLSATFYNCWSLTSIPKFDTPQLQNTQQMFTFCKRLTSVPLFDTSKVTNSGQMFYYCQSLTSVPKYNLANVGYAASMFYYASSITYLPEFDLGNNPYFNSMFYGMHSLKELPAINCNSAIDTSNWLGDMGLARSKLANVRITHSYTNMALGNVELNEIYTNLPTVTSQTITVTGNWGTGSDDPTIATAKGWTVTG